jgi:hypothetical protein
MKGLAILLIVLCQSISFSQLGFDHYFNYKTIDTNNISAEFTNYGNLVPLATWNQIQGQDLSIVYDEGPWIIGKLNGIPAASINEWFTLYSPGPIINGEAGILAQPEDSLTFRVYKISRGDDNSNPDYAEWPDTLGAPVDQNGDPLLYGDQTLWTVYNGVDSTLSSRNQYGEYYPPLPVEIRQTVFSHAGNYADTANIFSNVLFIEWTIINKGSAPIDSAYFALWSDIDFDGAIRNRPAVDSSTQLAYLWGDTAYYIETNPAVGFQLLYGPAAASSGDTAIFKGRQLPGYKNLPMTSYHGISDDAALDPLTGSIRSVSDAWNAARGFDLDGNVIINPVTNEPTKFTFSGDPVTQEGWLFPRNWGGGGAGFVFFSGPFNFAPQDTQWAMAALVPGLGGSYISSIVNMRQKVDILRSIPYDSLAWGNPFYGITSVKGIEDYQVPERFELQQNYPNPFNPATTIKYSIPPGISKNGVSLVTLKVYDILGRETATLVNEKKTAGEYEINFDASKLASGVYFYQLRAGSFTQTRKMVLLR